MITHDAEYYYERETKRGRHYWCPCCKKEIIAADFPDVVYVETKRKTKLFFHEGCVGSRWKRLENA